MHRHRRALSIPHPAAPLPPTPRRLPTPQPPPTVLLSALLLRLLPVSDRLSQLEAHNAELRARLTNIVCRTEGCEGAEWLNVLFSTYLWRKALMPWCAPPVHAQRPARETPDL